MLPANVLAPLDAVSLLSGYRKLIASPPEGMSLSREASQSVVCTAAEQAAAIGGFAALADAPDSLSTFVSVYATSLQDAERRGGGGGRGGSGRFDPARPDNSRNSGGRGLDEGAQLRVLRQILLAAPLLGRGSATARALAPFDGSERRHADERRSALEQLGQRCSADEALNLLCSDASASGGAFSFAPLRAIDLNAD